jgi:hypothetical protein
MSASGATGDEVLVAKTDLQAGALRLPEVLMQSVTLVAPAIATLFSFQFIIGFAGVSAPLAFLIVMFIALMLAVNLAMLARAFPSAGGYFTYLSRALHPRVGLFAGWLYFLISPLVPAPILVYMGTVLETELKSKYDFTFPWWLFAGLALAIVMFVTYRGIKLSGKTLIILGGAEIAIVVALSLWSAFDPGPGGFIVDRGDCIQCGACDAPGDSAGAVHPRLGGGTRWFGERRVIPRSGMRFVLRNTPQRNKMADFLPATWSSTNERKISRRRGNPRRHYCGFRAHPQSRGRRLREGILRCWQARFILLFARCRLSYWRGWCSQRCFRWESCSSITPSA